MDDKDIMGFDVADVLSSVFKKLFYDRFVFAVSLIVGLLGLFVSYAALYLTPTVAASHFAMIIAGLIGAFLLEIYLNSLLIMRVINPKVAKTGKVLRTAGLKYLGFLATMVMFSVISAVGLIAFVIPGVFLFIKLFPAPAAYLDKKESPFRSLERSWNMTKGKWWEVFAVVIVLVLIAWVVEMIFGFFSPLAGAFLGSFIGTTVTISSGYVYNKLKR